MNGVIPPPEQPFLLSLADQLRRLVETASTGTLLLTTVDSQRVQVSVEAGEIVYFSFQGEEGLRWLERHHTLPAGGGASRFVADRVLRAGTALPPTAAVLLMIEHAPSRWPNPPEHGAGELRARLRQVDKMIVAQELIEYLGPFASILCDEAWAVTEQLDLALDLLTRELNGPAQAAEFKDRVRRRIAEQA